MFLLCAWPQKNYNGYLMDGALAVLLFEWGRKESLFQITAALLKICMCRQICLVVHRFSSAHESSPNSRPQNQPKACIKKTIFICGCAAWGEPFLKRQCKKLSKQRPRDSNLGLRNSKSFSRRDELVVITPAEWLIPLTAKHVTSSSAVWGRALQTHPYFSDRTLGGKDNPFTCNLFLKAHEEERGKAGNDGKSYLGEICLGRRRGRWGFSWPELDPHCSG